MADFPPSAPSETLNAAPHTLLTDSNALLDSPRATFAIDETHSQTKFDSPNVSDTHIPNLDREASGSNDENTTPRKRRSLILLYTLVIFVIVVLAFILPVYFTVIKPNQSNGASSSSSSTSGSTRPGASPTAGSPTPAALIVGGDGSTITQDDGTTFTYTNKFGGYWVSDPNNPFNNDARPNSWTPPLNQSWRWGEDRIQGVNLGGWFVLEPFISPELFQRYPDAIDEWSISLLMAADTANGGLDQLEEHYKTFITEKDFADIAAAGLNWIRLPIPFWAIEKWDNEPYLEKTCWKYILRAFDWARKYGLRVNLDLHTIPGSQNGYNHSGKWGQVNFLNGVMGYANAQRAIEYIRVITQFISQPQYQELVPIFGIMNEAQHSVIGRSSLTSFYLEVHDMMRNITGVGEGKGPYMSIHDGFQGTSSWSDFLRGSDRIALDTHPYFAFSGGPALDPIATGLGLEAGGRWPLAACNRWALGMNSSRTSFGVTFAGEFSNGYNDCGLYLNGVRNKNPNYGGDCTFWQDSSRWNSTVKAGLKQFAMASMNSLGDWFFWTWKIGNSMAGHPESPLWSYSLGLQEGWMPADPREASGTCAALGVDGPDFDGNFEPWQTGGVGAGTIVAAETAQFPWPPTSITRAAAPVTLLPSYTPTANVVSLPPPTMTAIPQNVDVGSGWFNSMDTILAPTAIAGCAYPDAYDAVDAAVPPTCT